MAAYTVLYNPYAGNGRGEENTRAIGDFLPGEEIDFHDMTKIEDYGEFFRHLPPETRVILSGGDGTLNRFINDTSGLDIPQDIYYYAAGSGNDFLRDLGRKPEDGPFPIGEYLRALPVVTVNGKQYRFLNGIGYGIDGYCCQVGDEQREKSTKPVNYTAHCHQGTAVPLQAHERGGHRGWRNPRLPEGVAGTHHERPVLRRRDDADARGRTA